MNSAPVLWLLVQDDPGELRGANKEINYGDADPRWRNVSFFTANYILWRPQQALRAIIVSTSMR